VSPFRTRVVLFCGLIVCSTQAPAQPRPNLVVTAPDAKMMQAARGKYALFDRTVADAVQLMEAAFQRPMSVPVPADAGGPTHERHKQNYLEMQTAGVLYAMTGESRYADFVRDMLMRYAELYPRLPLHPAANSQEAGGRLFWQTLNETVWLLHAAQAYDCVHDRITPADRRTIEGALLRPMARFFTDTHESSFNRIHNHGTWMVGAVGMLGFALRDRELVEQSLYGTRKDSTAGFMRQVRMLFSPDGYYTEGPYYTRYAVMPFFLFARAIDNNLPELKIFAFRDSILHKVLHAALQQTTPAGTFIPMNDALKEMSIAAKEIVAMVAIGYDRCGGDRELLSLAASQGRVMLSGSGLRVARDLAAGPAPAYRFRSIELRDGPDGTGGGVGLLRSSDGGEKTLLVMKYASQGMGHGHFDRLGLLYYDQGREVLQDYGAVRFINVETKDGGRYLPENSSWAKQTIAHNTVTVDGRSHFDGTLARAEKHSGQRRFFDITDSTCQSVSALAENVAPGVRMQRTVLLVRDARFSAPVVIDVFRITSDESHRYDLPFYYHGHLVNTTLATSAHTRTREAAGGEQGYQHLWVEATTTARDAVQWTWLLGSRYYSVTSAADSGTEVLFVRLGAGDPAFNLRPDPGVIIRRRAASCVFASVIEPHGQFEPVEEISRNARPAVRNVRVLADSDEGTVVEISGDGGLRWRVCVANGTPARTATRAVAGRQSTYTWKGNVALERNAQ
jgi:hypothetical protein